MYSAIVIRIGGTFVGWIQIEQLRTQLILHTADTPELIRLDNPDLELLSPISGHWTSPPWKMPTVVFNKSVSRKGGTPQHPPSPIDVEGRLSLNVMIPKMEPIRKPRPMFWPGP